VADIQVDTFRAEFFKTLGHPVRIKILRLIRSGEKNVKHLQESLGLDASVTSQHLMALRAKNLVTARKEGTKVFYAVRDPKIYQLLDLAREIFDRHLIDSRAMLDELEREERTLIQSNAETQ
jgi:DNA-binding transcriptional ArsR family regulator